ncbi:hypothetical protein PILCRDRAFT_447518 [Piloderma croceum F 1598]|uniref:Uncharacterized protein n=1 Tax=Piloderma croceum (strain F 1598) TaxID=765440 RepID=A0A0C3C048_PILCF|nr:hypothetical protein PILCRDRAFT_447518 [Piloderma croceum F 1598]
MWGSLTNNHPPVRNGRPQKKKKQHVGRLKNSYPFFKWERQLLQLTGLLRYWQTWPVKWSQKLGMSCQDTDNETNSVDVLRRETRVDTGREASEKQKLS